MSYADTADDELDYGEGELGEAVTAGVSLGVPQDDDDDIAQDGEYDDLYDDVNIGYFEAPPAPAGDGYQMEDDDEGYEQKPDVKPPIRVESEVTEHAAIVPQISGSVAPVPLAAASLPQPVKVEQNEELQDDIAIPGVSSRVDPSLMYAGQQKESASRSTGAVDGVQGRQMQLFLSPNTKEQGSGHNNGFRQGGNPALHMQEKTYSPTSLNAASASGNGDTLSGSFQTSHVGGHAGGGLSVGPGKAPNDMLKERGVIEDMSHDRTRGTTTSLSRPTQRAASPIMVENENFSRPPYSGDGNGMLFVGDLHWWTTDAELEAALSEYGRVKNLKFFEERVSGKSKGYCQVEFYDHNAAVACKHGMHGRRFHDRPCIVALGNPKSIQHLGYQQEKKTQAQFQAQQEQVAARRNNSISAGGTRGGSSYQERDSGRGYGRMGSGRVGMNNKTGQAGGGRGRGSYMNKGMGGGGGSNAGGGMPYGQPMGGHQSAMMMHQGMMGQGYDPAYGPMGRGAAAYGGYVMPGPPFPGMVAPFPAMGPGGLPGVAPHVNPAFFGRPNGMGLMPGGSMEGPHQGMWGDASLGGWGGEEQDRRTRDGSYMDDGAGMDYGYNNDMGHEKSRTSGRDKENGDWSERHRRDDRDGDWERETFREKDRDVYRDQRDKERNRDKDEEWDRDRSFRPRHRSRMVEEEDDPRQKLREEDYGRKRRMMEERIF